MKSYRSNYPISRSEITEICPAIFAAQPAPDRSLQFKYVSTIEALDALADEGFLPFMIAQANTKDPNQLSYARHMIRLRKENTIQNEGANEIILLNANDGTTAATMLAGYIRFACSNGLVQGDNVNTVKIYHRGTITGQYIEGAYTVMKNFEKTDEFRDEMKSITLTKDQAIIYAEESLALKYEDSRVPITPQLLLTPRRLADTKEDLWTTFNVVQENLTRGNQYHNAPLAKKGITRPVNDIKRNTALNQALWSLTEKMAQLIH